MPAGVLIVFEGPEGAGKSTQIRRLTSDLAAASVPFLAVREPGGTALGNEIRRLLLDAPHEMHARAEALLFMASRAELVEREIRPALAAGTLVVADRFFLSTYAYQMAGRGLPEADVVAANRFATAGLRPDLTVLLQMPVGAGLARADRRGHRDRIERADDDFHTRVAAGFASFSDPAWQRVHPEAGPIVAIDANAPEGVVYASIGRELSGRWPETFGALTESNQ
jgi:dTMP kinase